MERRLEITGIIIKFLRLDLSNLKWRASQRKQKRRDIIIQGESTSKAFEQHKLHWNRTGLL